jgi:hypothetical protein
VATMRSWSVPGPRVGAEASGCWAEALAARAKSRAAAKGNLKFEISDFRDGAGVNSGAERAILQSMMRWKGGMQAALRYSLWRLGTKCRRSIRRRKKKKG